MKYNKTLLILAAVSLIAIALWVKFNAGEPSGALSRESPSLTSGSLIKESRQKEIEPATDMSPTAALERKDVWLKGFIENVNRQKMQHDEEASEGYQNKVAGARRSEIKREYAPFFSRMNFSGEKAAKLENLILEKTLARGSIMQVVSAQVAAGQIPPGDSAKIMEEVTGLTEAKITEQIKASLSEAEYVSYSEYASRIPQYALAAQLSLALTPEGRGLQDGQVQELVSLLSASGVPADASKRIEIDVSEGTRGSRKVEGRTVLTVPDGGYHFDSNGNVFSNVSLTEETISAAGAFLSPAQLDALRRISKAQLSMRVGPK